MDILARLLNILFNTLAQLINLLFRTLGRLGRYWVNDMRQRRTTQGKVASFSIGMFAILCACSFPIALLNPDRQSTAAQAGIRQADQSRPTASPEVVADVGNTLRDAVVEQAKLRGEPSALAASIGTLCPGDHLEYIEQHQAAMFRYFRVKVHSVGASCDERHVREGVEGWVNVEDVTPPSDGVASVPTTTPQPEPTAVPRPTSPPRPTRVPTATPPAPPVAQAESVANVRSEPRVDPSTVRGKLCPGDTLEYVSLQQAGDELWYRVRVVAVGPECDPQRAPVGFEGWAAASVLADPSYDVRRYASEAGVRLPTAIPPTVVPTRVPAPQPVAPQQRCDPSYPDFCLPPGTGDLNCPDIPYRRFRVVGADPHGFDRDRDGIGCES